MSRFILLLLYLTALVVLLYYAWDGMDYYQTALLDRPHHLEHQNVKPGGIRGHGLGILGTGMMILLLTYSLRKRGRVFGQLGTITRWLDFHIFLGIMGPLFVILHTAFKLNGIVAISFWSMIAVALSGVLGRYLYLQIPRNIQGNELHIQDLEQANKEFTHDILSEYSVTELDISVAENKIAGTISQRKSGLGILVSMLFSDVFRFFRIMIIKRYLRKKGGLSRIQTKKLIETMKKKAILNRRIILWEKVHQLFHYWHVIHKPFAIVMYLIMIIHVALTVIFGYRWIF